MSASVIMIALTVAFMESVAQSHVKDNKLLVGMLFYACVGYMLHWAYSLHPLSKVNISWSCISIVLATLLGYYLYGEEVNRNSIISATLALVAIYFSSK